MIRQATVNWLRKAGENSINGGNDDTQQRLGDDDDVTMKIMAINYPDLPSDRTSQVTPTSTSAIHT